LLNFPVFPSFYGPELGPTLFVNIVGFKLCSVYHLARIVFMPLCFVSVNFVSIFDYLVELRELLLGLIMTLCNLSLVH